MLYALRPEAVCIMTNDSQWLPCLYCIRQAGRRSELGLCPEGSEKGKGVIPKGIMTAFVSKPLKNPNLINFR